MRRCQFEAIVRRDLCLFFRTAWFFLPLAIAQVLVMQLTAMGSVLKPDVLLPVQHAILAGLLASTPAMVIPFFGNMFLNKAVLEDRLRQTLIRTLLTGIQPGTLWWTKFTLAASLAYVIMLICEVAVWALAWMRTGAPLAVSPPVLANILIVNPAISLAVLATMSLLYWVFKRPGMLITFIPMIIMLGSWMLAASSPLTTLFSPVTAGVILSVAAGVIFLCGWISSRISKERIAGLY
ncbi:MAG TPA: hypothetical protein VJG32_15300 [Anaerolineae bacterium]|nr:hypothetical protein [Anaerolineae bacterium]